MGVFRFKRFEVVNERSAMKVNTDGVLLGAIMHIDGSEQRILDVGTGTGTIALMAAQRLEGKAVVHAIDIDGDSADEASANFLRSPWKESLHAFHLSLDSFGRFLDDDIRYDLIFSNPPYFDSSLEAPEGRRNNARHTSSGLSYRELLEFAEVRLAESGRFAIVLPADQEKPLVRHAAMCGLFPFSITRIRTVPRKDPNRIVAEFSRNRCLSPKDTTLTIQNEGKYTQEYLSLTRDFYLFA